MNRQPIHFPGHGPGQMNLRNQGTGELRKLLGTINSLCSYDVNPVFDSPVPCLDAVAKYAVTPIEPDIQVRLLERPDEQARYQHPILVVETLVDPAQFCGPVYTANGWVERGLTDGCRRVHRDYYERHDRPKWLFARERVPSARRRLQAEHLKPSLAVVAALDGGECRGHQFSAGPVGGARAS